MKTPKLDYEKIGNDLVSHAKSEGCSKRQILENMRESILEASDYMSSRKISEWLKINHNIEISYSLITKFLQKNRNENTR
ncbi:hypothetical protein EGM51_03690 [Verrucomicrobia bacterium S94]|nr:hypothetical protein EGM51_03690 [Verrucomicrobia bacterium S94]